MSHEPQPPSERSVRIGEVLAGKYRVERILGYGGMGVVVAAMHEQLEERVAIKLLLSSGLGKPAAIQRFVREARAAVKIKNEHVARVLDVDTLPDGRLYMVMEYLEGRDLGQVLAQGGPLPESEAVDYVLQVCEALVEAHALGIVHRDLKPSNCFLTETASGKHIVKVLDFGISKMTGPRESAAPDDLRLTTPSSMIGSPLYMSPEQIRNAASVDARSDIWSLGVLLHELLTRQMPFMADSQISLLASIAADPPTPLREHKPDASPELEAIILRCLEKNPADRPQTVLDLARQLGQFGPQDAVPSIERALRSAERPSRISIATLGTRASSPAVDEMAETVGTFSQTSPARSSHRTVLAATIIGGLAAVITAAILTWGAGSGSKGDPAPAAAGSALAGPAGPVEPSPGSVVAPAAPAIPVTTATEPAATGSALPAAPSSNAALAPDGGPATGAPTALGAGSDDGLKAKPAASGKPAVSAAGGGKVAPAASSGGSIVLGKEVESRR